MNTPARLQFSARISFQSRRGSVLSFSEVRFSTCAASRSASCGRVSMAGGLPGSFGRAPVVRSCGSGVAVVNLDRHLARGEGLVDVEAVARDLDARDLFVRVVVTAFAVVLKLCVAVLEVNGDGASLNDDRRIAS